MRAHLDISHEGSLSAEDRTRMSFDQNSIAHLMSILTDLYSDPELAVIREYSINAWDSHRAAGNSDPIEVYLPTELDPVFKVIDHGTGMSVEDITENFSKYGWSSKRDTDNEAGMLGLGCKSALTYTSQFTLVAIQNRVKATVLVTREDDGAGAVQIIDTVSTIELDGVEVRVPVKNWSTFGTRAWNFFRFWEAGSVLVDRVEPDHWATADKTITLDPDIFVTPELSQDYIIMGNVAYPHDHTKGRFLGSRNTTAMACVVRVPIGTVNFTPSREALQYNKRTLEVIQDIREYVQSALERVAQAEVDACPDHLSALKVGAKWRKLFWNRHLKYQGEPIPEKFYLDPLGTTEEYVCRAFRWNTKYKSTEATTRLDLSESVDLLLKGLHVVGFTSIMVRNTQKEKIRQWWKDQGETDPVNVYLYPKKVGGAWLEGVRTVPYEVIKAVKIERPDPCQRTTGPTFRVLSNGNGNVQWVYDLDPTKKLAYVVSKEYNERELLTIGQYAHLNKIQVVLVPATRVQKFVATHKAVHVKDFVKRDLDRFLKKLSPSQIYMLTDNTGWQNAGFQRLDINLIQDPALAGFLRGVTPNVNESEWNKLIHLCRVLILPVPKLPGTTLSKQIQYFQNLYPLVGQVASYARRDLVQKQQLTEYVNALYAARQLRLP